MATPSSAGLMDDGFGAGELRSPAPAPSAGGSTGSTYGVSGGQPLARAEQRDAPYCYSCGNAMQRAGSCYVCGSCGTTSGCS